RSVLGPPRSTLFPSTTLFRSELDGSQAYRRLTSLTIARRVELSPDGRWLAIDTNDTLPSWPPSADHDVEIVLIDTATGAVVRVRSEEHTSELQSRENLVCRLL